jgi:hypothetical protein
MRVGFPLLDSGSQLAIYSGSEIGVLATEEGVL